jgi:hypothetical protein
MRSGSEVYLQETALLELVNVVVLAGTRGVLGSTGVHAAAVGELLDAEDRA